LGWSKWTKPIQIWLWSNPHRDPSLSLSRLSPFLLSSPVRDVTAAACCSGYCRPHPSQLFSDSYMPGYPPSTPCRRDASPPSLVHPRLTLARHDLARRRRDSAPLRLRMVPPRLPRLPPRAVARPCCVGLLYSMVV
jgi:hypothetical protein